MTFVIINLNWNKCIRPYRLSDIPVLPTHKCTIVYLWHSKCFVVHLQLASLVCVFLQLSQQTTHKLITQICPPYSWTCKSPDWLCQLYCESWHKIMQANYSLARLQPTPIYTVTILTSNYHSFHHCILLQSGYSSLLKPEVHICNFKISVPTS